MCTRFIGNLIVLILIYICHLFNLVHLLSPKHEFILLSRPRSLALLNTKYLGDRNLSALDVIQEGGVLVAVMKSIPASEIKIKTNSSRGQLFKQLPVKINLQDLKTAANILAHCFLQMYLLLLHIISYSLNHLLAAINNVSTEK